VARPVLRPGTDGPLDCDPAACARGIHEAGRNARNERIAARGADGLAGELLVDPGRVRARAGGGVIAVPPPTATIPRIGRRGRAWPRGAGARRRRRSLGRRPEVRGATVRTEGQAGSATPAGARIVDRRPLAGEVGEEDGVLACGRCELRRPRAPPRGSAANAGAPPARSAATDRARWSSEPRERRAAGRGARGECHCPRSAPRRPQEPAPTGPR
jgi:hypothetical protein